VGISRQITGVLAAALLAALLPGCAENKDKGLKAVPEGTERKPSAERTAPSGQPEVVNAPAWRPGDRWRYSDGYGLRVASADGDLTVFQRIDDPKQWFSRYGFLRQESQARDALRKVVFRTIKPEEGLRLSLGQPLVFTREYLSGKNLRVHSTSWLVEGRETITVPAGEFDCWLIVMRTRGIRTGWTGFERWWYSPQVKNYVRLEYKYGNQPASSRVLVSFVTSD
jgi:hypothetical protein